MTALRLSDENLACIRFPALARHDPEGRLCRRARSSSGEVGRTWCLPTRPTTSSSKANCAAPTSRRSMPSMTRGTSSKFRAAYDRLHPRLAAGRAAGVLKPHTCSDLGHKALITTSSALRDMQDLGCLGPQRRGMAQDELRCPNFAGVRFQNAHETMIWASRDRACEGLCLQLRN